MLLKAAVKPVANHFGGMLSGGVNADFSAGCSALPTGGSFTQGRVMPFATGGVVNGPVAFPMRGGLGLMGEAGPEAIMPLSRGRTVSWACAPRAAASRSRW